MPKLLKIITEPNPILRNKSEEVNITEIINLKELFNDMFFTMKKSDGVGLAAPQIGLNIRVIVVRVENEKFIMINPVITKKSWACANEEEGCLSVPKTFGKVKRHKKINCIFFDEFASKKKIQAQGMLARVIQHEIDHLNGILFTDFAKNIEINK